MLAEDPVFHAPSTAPRPGRSANRDLPSTRACNILSPVLSSTAWRTNRCHAQNTGMGFAMHARLLSTLVSLLLVTSHAIAATPPLPGVVDTLEQRLAPCSYCHGKQGEGVRQNEYYPRIAGKPAGYLYRQLRNFRDGRRTYPANGLFRPSPFGRLPAGNRDLLLQASARISHAHQADRVEGDTGSR